MSGSKLPDDLTETVRGILDDVLGTAAHVDLRVLGAHRDYWVLSATAAARPRRSFVVKLAGPGTEHPVDLDRTAAVVDLVRGTGTPVPEVVATRTADRDGWRWQVLEQVPGTPWRLLARRLGRDETDACHRQIAEALLRIQTIRFDGFGELGADARPEPPQGWPDALRCRATERITDPRRRDSFLEVLDRTAPALADVGPPTLCHDDVHHDNVLFARGADGWRLAAVLDWDKAWSAEPLADVARTTLWDDMTGPAFWDVYRAAVPERAGDDERAWVHQLLWCLEYDVDTPRHRADTAAVAAKLRVRLD